MEISGNLARLNTTAAFLGGGGGSFNFENYDNSHPYPKPFLVYIDTPSTISGITTVAGFWIAIVDVPASGTANQIPQFPYPGSGTLYWRLIAPKVRDFEVCDAGVEKTSHMAGTPPA